MTTPPQNTAIIGAGIMGLSAAYMLLQASHKVTIYDLKGFPAENASWMAGGMLAPYSEIEHISAPWIEAGLAGIEFWQEHFPNLVQQNGGLLIAHEEDRYILERFRQYLPSEKQKMYDVAACEPQLSERFSHGLYLEEEAHLDPEETMTTLLTIIKQSANLKPSAYEGGDYDWVIDCRGYDAQNNELRGVKGEMMIVRNKEFSLSRPVRLMHPRYPLYIVPREYGVFMIGATQIESADEQFNLRSGLELMSALYSLHPSFGEAEILDMRASIRPAYPDNLPRIRIEENTIKANGLFRHGYLLAPVMAQAITDHLAGKINPYMMLFTPKCHSERGLSAEALAKVEAEESHAIKQGDFSAQGPRNDRERKDAA